MEKETMKKEDLAISLKHQGYNCCQAILCAFQEETGLSEEALKKIGAAFGVGMGNMEASCGALCAAEILLGLKEYQDKPVAPGERIIRCLRGKMRSGIMQRSERKRYRRRPVRL